MKGQINKCTNHILKDPAPHEDRIHHAAATTNCPQSQRTSTTIIQLQLSATVAVANCQDTTIFNLHLAIMMYQQQY